LHLRQVGACRECHRKSDRELHGAERDAAIAGFMAWLNGRLPSEAIRDEAKREPLAIDAHMTEHAGRYIRHARGRHAWR
jgi:formate-dependent nitrite reductase cytochrome c552 subunit